MGDNISFFFCLVSGLCAEEEQNPLFRTVGTSRREHRRHAQRTREANPTGRTQSTFRQG